MTSVKLKWLAFVLNIQEVPAANLGPDSECPACSVSLFSSVPHGIREDSDIHLGTFALSLTLSNLLFINYSVI
jgi:hypothetical protein